MPNTLEYEFRGRNSTNPLPSSLLLAAQFLLLFLFFLVVVVVVCPIMFLLASWHHDNDVGFLHNAIIASDRFAVFVIVVVAWQHC